MRTARIVEGKTVPEQFLQTKAAHGDRLALIGESLSLTYSQLDKAANRIANALVSDFADGSVAVLMQQDAPQCVALLATLKSGRITVFLNPLDPALRLGQILADADVAIILADRPNQDLARTLAGTGRCVLLYEDMAAGNENAPQVTMSPADCAVLVYTSGSTGQPKAVMVPHRQLIHNVAGLAEAMEITEADRLPLLGALTGLQAVNAACLAWQYGAALYPFPTVGQGVTGLPDWIASSGITAYTSSASLFRSLLKTAGDPAMFDGVRVARLGSESASAEDFRNFQHYFRNASHFVHALSSSETGLMAYYRIHRAMRLEDGRIPIGRPAAGLDITLLDEHGQPAAPHVPGEIVIKSAFLSTGYWKDPARTLERFRIDAATGLTVYRTGDLARWNEDGLLEFTGRDGQRINIRGYRIEPREVEDAIRQLPAVEAVVVSARTKPNEDTELAAHIVLRAGQNATTSALRRGLRALLPRYMIPSTIILMDHFPLTGHGKINRALLPHEAPPEQAAPYEPPATATEIWLAAGWAKILEQPRIGRDDDFFDLGGDSLSAAAVTATIYAEYGVVLDLGLIFDAPVLKDFVARLEVRIGAAGQSNDGPVRVPPGTALPLSFEEEWIWFASQTPAEIADYTDAARYDGKGVLDIGVFEECLTYMARRHEVLRTSYRIHDGQPAAFIQPPAHVSLTVCHADPAQEMAPQVSEFIARETACMRDPSQVFDLAKPPLYRFSLLRTGPETFVLLNVTHHIFYDGPSWKIYFRELVQLYAARLKGEDFPLPAERELQYADVTVWRRAAWQRDPQIERQLATWWMDYLHGAPRRLKLKFAYTRWARFRRRHARSQPQDGVQAWRLNRKDAGRLAMLGHTTSVTGFILRLAIFLALLHEETKMPDVVIGTYTTLRGQVPGGDTMFGYFTNVTLLRSRLQGDPSLRDWIGTVKKNLLSVVANSHYPTAMLRQEYRKAGRHIPALSIIFSDHTPRSHVQCGSMTLRHADRVRTRMPWSFSTRFEEYDGIQECRTTFDANRFDAQAVRQFLERYRRLLMIAAPELLDAPLTQLLEQSARQAVAAELTDI